jgi:hypothetical protein
MKTIIYAVLAAFALFSCSLPKEKKVNQSTFEILIKNGRMDTVNFVDSNGLKQGIWISKFSPDTTVMLNDTGHSTKNTTFGEVKRRLEKYGNSGTKK